MDIKNKLNIKRPLIATQISLNYSVITEIIGKLDFDFLWIDMEHTSIDKEGFLKHLISARAVKKSIVVRVPWNDPIIIKPILEMGPNGIVFPFISSAEEAKKAVASCLYPPKGIRGFGPIRALDYGGMDVKEYLDGYDKLLWKVMQIETVRAIDELEKILAVEGVDAIVIGPNDLAASMGLLGNYNHPKVIEKIYQICDIANSLNKPFGVSVCDDFDLISMLLKKNISFILVGQDYLYLKNGAREILDKAKNLISED